jgi:hypothetical protein
MAQDPTYERNLRSTWDQRRLLGRVYRDLRRRGDTAGALKIAQQADQMGIPVSRPVASEDVAGVASIKTGGDMERESISRGGSPSSALGVGGYDFRQTRVSPLARPEPQSPETGGDLLPMPPVSGTTDEPQAAPIESGVGGYSFEQTRQSPLATQGSSAYPSVQNVDRRAAFSRAWNMAKTQAEKDSLVERAQGLGVPMNENGEAALQRLGKSLLPAPNLVPSTMADDGTSGPQQPAQELEGVANTERWPRNSLMTRWTRQRPSLY